MAIEAKEYAVACATDDLDEFEKEVDDFLSRGWQIIPEGFRVIYTGDTYLFYQSMYLPKESQ